MTSVQNQIQMKAINPPAKNKPFERSSSINPNDDLEDYQESGCESDQGKEI